MFDYLQKFKNLPKELREKLSAPQKVAQIEDLEKKYRTDLAPLVMKLAVGDIEWQDLAGVLGSDFELNREEAGNLERDLRQIVFAGISKKEEPESKDLPDLAEDVFDEKPVKETSPNFFFSAEDEEEIKKIKKNGFSQKESKDYDKAVDDIFEKIDIIFSDRELENRFKTILLTFLRGVRNKIDTREAFKKPIIRGGLDLGDGVIDKIFSLAQKEKENFSLKSGNSLLADKIDKAEKKDFDITAGRDYDYDLASAIKQRKEKEESKKEEKAISNVSFKKDNQKSEEPKNNVDKKQETNQIKNSLDTEHELPPPLPVKSKENNIESQTPEIPEAESRKEEKIYDEKWRREEEQRRLGNTIKPKEDKIGLTKKILAKANPGKKKLDDVKHIPRVMTPIEELKYMNLDVFRRLSDDPDKAVEKIKAKIDLLEEEHYGRRLEGIKAWRVSPINKLYLKIGHLSMEENKNVDDVINDLREKGEKYLDLDEFNAIMDLNRVIKY